VLAVELLKRVVGEHRGAGLLGDPEEEGITPPNGPGRRGHHLTGHLGLLEGGKLGGIDPMSEGGINHHGDDVIGVLPQELPDRLVQLGQVGEVPTFRCDVGAVDDDVARGHVKQESTMPGA
jgi:hypothetical protein